jgi:hypothetical protein
MRPRCICDANAGGAPAGAGAEEGEGEEEAPQKFESEVAVNEESGSIAFKGKAKFSHLAKDDTGKASWEGKGMGTLMLRVRNDGSNKPFVTFTTEAVSGSEKKKGRARLGGPRDGRRGWGLPGEEGRERGGGTVPVTKWDLCWEDDSPPAWTSLLVSMKLKPRPDFQHTTTCTVQGRVLYIANISKTMQVILVEGRNNVTFSAPWSPDGQAPPTAQSVMFMLPKGRCVGGSN